MRAEEFSLDSHRRIFARISDMIEAARAVDIITLSEELRTQQQLEAVGGVAYLASLTDGVPPRANIHHYVRIVKDKALLRGLINLSNKAIGRALEQSEPVDAILNDAEQGLIQLSQDARDIGFASVSDIVKAARHHQAHHQPDRRNHRTGHRFRRPRRNDQRPPEGRPHHHRRAALPWAKRRWS